MDAVAIAARPRLWLAGALLAITLLGGHEPCRAPTPVRALALHPVAIEGVPAPAVVIQLVPRSDLAALDRRMVQAPPDTGDRMNSGMAPLASWISHLLQKLAGDAC